MTATGTLWVDASAGASGDMILGALLAAGVPLGVISEAVDAVAPEPVALTPEEVRRAGLAATRCHVEIADSAHHRTWRDVRALIEAAALDAAVAELAIAVFGRLADAEAAVHGTSPEDVHFHEVGALDAIADVVGACAGFVHLAAERVVVSPVAVGSGTVRGAHGVLPVPPPAVARLLVGVPSLAGPAAFEACTPTGAAILTTVATGWGPQPPMSVSAVGVGAGGKDPETHANVVRILVGERLGFEARSARTSTNGGESVVEVRGAPAPSLETSGGESVVEVRGAPAPSLETTGELVIEANVDDLDPRAWPHVLETLMAAGAADAWLSPIQMKKGRPAYTLHALVAPDRAEAVRDAVFAQTSTIGLREYAVTKRALPREVTTVSVGGHQVAVKIARLRGRIVNAQPEWEDVARAAAALGQPVADVLAAASAAAQTLRQTPWE